MFLSLHLYSNLLLVQRFYFIDLLHSLSRESQGVHLYPLLLAMMSYALEPYFRYVYMYLSGSLLYVVLIVSRFVEQWVFLGQLDCGVEFGIYGNQVALERRGKCTFDMAQDMH